MVKKTISVTRLLHFFLVFVLASFNLCNAVAETHGLFVFGSSLVDNGNNNFVDNSAKADYLPYGIDYPLGPSGRFSNGMNEIDVLARQLKLRHRIPSFLNPKTKGREILHGVDYASGGSGILDETGNIQGRAISLNEQIKSFETVTLPDLGLRAKSISKFLFVIGAGGNDYLLNYFLPNNTNRPSLEVFTAKLIGTLSGQIKKLHSLGARKFVLLSVYPLGCIPVVKKNFHMPQGCVENLNMVALLFNSRMKSLVDDLKQEMPRSNLVFVNTYEMINDIIKAPMLHGFININDPCCEVNGKGILCKRGGVACEDRKGHVFFDGLHPTEAVNSLIARKAYSSLRADEVYPFNVRKLAEI